VSRGKSIRSTRDDVVLDWVALIALSENKNFVENVTKGKDKQRWEKRDLYACDLERVERGLRSDVAASQVRRP